MTDRCTFGVIGLGAMGGGMARALIAAGYPVLGVDPDENARQSALNAGVRADCALVELLADADVIPICLPSEAALLDVYGAIADHPAPKPQTIIETSTIAPDRAKAFAEISRGSGRRHLEACLIGLPKDAAAGQLYHFVGGDPDVVTAAGAFLDATGRGFAHLGDVGCGASAKVLNNAIGNITMLAFTEAIVASQRLGLDPAAFVRSVAEASGAGMSVVFERHARWAVSSDNQPPTPINHKDMHELGRMLGGNDIAFSMMGEATRIVGDLPGNRGLVQAYARQLHARD